MPRWGDKGREGVEGRRGRKEVRGMERQPTGD